MVQDKEEKARIISTTHYKKIVLAFFCLQRTKMWQSQNQGAGLVLVGSGT